MRGGLTIDEVAVLSGDELLRYRGRDVYQQLVDMIVAAVRRGDDDEAKAIDGRLKEVTQILYGDSAVRRLWFEPAASGRLLD